MGNSEAAPSKSKEQLKEAVSLGGQINELIARGFAKKLGMSEEEYKKSFPPFAPRPKDPKYPRDIVLPLVVDPRVSLLELYKRQEIDKIKKLYTINIAEIAAEEARPNVPYTVWIHLQQFTNDKPFTPEQAIKRFTENEEGSSPIEPIHLYFQYPDRYTLRGIIALGLPYRSAYYLGVTKPTGDKGDMPVFIAYPRSHASTAWRGMSRFRDTLRLSQHKNY